MYKQKLKMCRGIQGSGKSTFAKKFVAENRNWVRISNDDLRLMFFNRVWDEKDTKDIDFAREFLIVEFLKQGKSVIVDAMNLSPKYEERYRKRAYEYNCEFEIEDFTGVPLKTCIERDKQRPNPVGEKVIRKTWKQFIFKEPPKIEYDPQLQDCIISDLDGTLALMCDRSPYDEAKADQDYLNKPVLNVIQSMQMQNSWNHKWAFPKRTPILILMSGRDEGRGREATERWLRDNEIEYESLYMRKAGDMTSDDIVKEQLYNEHIKGKYNVMAVFDDRLRVCRVWNQLGLPLFRVGDPDADF